MTEAMNPAGVAIPPVEAVGDPMAGTEAAAQVAAVIPAALPNAPTIEAIKTVYTGLHESCGGILHASFQGELAQRFAESHIFVNEFGRWVEAISPNKEAHLLTVAAKEHQYALLALVQGQYRQAFKGLRLVLELSLQAAHLSAHQVELQEWLESRKDTVWGVLVDEDNGVLSLRFARAFFPELEVDVRHHRSLAQQIYRECSECVHGSMQKHIPLPETLIFSPESFDLWHRKAKSVALVVAFALALRYLRDMKAEQLKMLEHDLLDRLGHVTAIRRRFGGPEGG